MRLTILIVAIFAALRSLECGAAPVDFAHEAAPILAARCTKCHANGRYEAELSFDTRESLLKSGVVEPGQSRASALIDRVASEDPDYRMPPEGMPLAADEIDVLRRWIDEGAAWDSGFTFRKSTYEAPLKPRRPKLPASSDGVDNPLDAIVQTYWREHGIAVPPLADDATFCRRVHLDLVGLLPEPNQLAAFVEDRDPRKRAALVTRLLCDRVAYADHWMTFWNDHLRNDYAGAGYIDGGRRQITAWLYRSLVDNKAYDHFVRELIAPASDAAGFAKGIVWRGQVNASQRPALQFAQNVGQVFLGVNLKCASCHDSFVDDWKLTDAYGLAAIASDGPLELHRCDKPTGELASPRFLFPELGQIDAEAPRDARMHQLAALMTHPQNGRLARTIVNRLWNRLMGRGIVHPVDSMGTAPWSEDLLDYLAVHLADSNYDLKKSLELIATSQVYALQTVNCDESAPTDEFVFGGPTPRRMTAEQFVDALASITGAAPAATDDDKIFVRIASDASGVAQPRPFVRAALVEWTPLMRTLGRPSREQVVTARPVELTTLEALELTNGQQLADLLAAGADRLLAEQPTASAEDVVRRVFLAALSREPTSAELAPLVDLAGTPLSPHGLADALWCIVMLPEFQVIR